MIDDGRGTQVLTVLLGWKNQTYRCELERTKRLDGHLLRDLENSQNFVKIGGKILVYRKFVWTNLS